MSKRHKDRNDPTLRRRPVRGSVTLAYIWERSCRNKIAYADRLDALREALIMGEQHRKPFNVYACSCCGQFHVGGAK